MKNLINVKTDPRNAKALLAYYNYIRHLVWEAGKDNLVKASTSGSKTLYVFRKAAIAKFLEKNLSDSDSSRSYEKLLNNDNNVLPQTINRIADDFNIGAIPFDDFSYNKKLVSEYSNYKLDDAVKLFFARADEKNKEGKETEETFYLEGEYTIYCLCSNKINVEKNHLIIKSNEDACCMSPHAKAEYNYKGKVKTFRGKYVNINLDYDSHLRAPFFIDYYLELEPEQGIEDEKITNGLRVMRSSYKNLPYASRFAIFKGRHGDERYEEFALFPLSQNKKGELFYDETADQRTKEYLKNLNNENVNKVFEMFTGDEYNLLIAFDKDKPFEREIRYDSLYYHAAERLAERLMTEQHEGDDKRDLIHRIKYCLNKSVKNGLKDKKKIAAIKEQCEKGGLYSHPSIKKDLVFVRDDFFYVKSLFLNIKKDENKKR
ncbi:MAG: hypothetical protein ABI723_14090 [Bacteroidia bacterium]